MARPRTISPRRLRALVRKETYQIVRDPSSIAIALVLPVVLLLLFGYGISLDPRQIPIAVVLEHPSPEAVDLAARFTISDYFAPVPMNDFNQAETLLRKREVDAILRIRSNFSRELAAGRMAPIQLIVDAVDANRARQIEGYVTGAWQRWTQSQAALQGAPPPIVEVAPRYWFNSEVRSQNFLVPGIVVLVMTLTGTLLTAMVMAREWERGTMEALLVTPVSVPEIVLGKLIPYFVLGMMGMVLCVVMSFFLFDVPFRGSLAMLALLSSVFMFAMLGLGLFISAMAKNQFVAGQTSLITAFLPAFFLSGFIFELSSAPTAIRVVSHIVPARYFVAVVQSIFLAGNVWSVLVPNGAAMAVLAFFFLMLAFKKTRKSLE
ncbi:ABC transporter permease [Oceanidesulfovibrio indonesiensis]|uniref:ABC transporter permease n=1 Tax=Oceanidesulfovibrio indonesiensis TaxID=54767 RepID=UPI001431032A|nr:ABC transporter permease [Oceanidesulfovibrio indonesiensis]